MKTFFPYSNQEKKRLHNHRFDDYDKQRELKMGGDAKPDSQPDQE